MRMASLAIPHQLGPTLSGQTHRGSISRESHRLLNEPLCPQLGYHESINRGPRHGRGPTELYAGRVDTGEPISYGVLAPGTPVCSADGQQIGTVAHVLAAEDEDVFDGIVIAEQTGSARHRFADADDVRAIYEHAVVLKHDRAACEKLPEPRANPAVMRHDPGEPEPGPLGSKLKRAWDLISGNY
jgi:hypothetical protein